ncbi:Cytochrome b [Termitomyces sp. J132]|nr:Cytochrome b [Termitomyces sp. J132]
MFGSLLILLVLPLTDLSRIRALTFRPAMKFVFWLFIINFFILMWIGSQHPDTPYLEIGQISTAFYFAWFLIIIPFVGIAENTLLDIAYDFEVRKSEFKFNEIFSKG